MIKFVLFLVSVMFVASSAFAFSEEDISRCDVESSPLVLATYDFQKCAPLIQLKCSMLSEEEIADIKEYRAGIDCPSNFTLEIIMMQVRGAADVMDIKITSQELAQKVFQTATPTKSQIEQIKIAAMDIKETIMLVMPDEEKMNSAFPDLK